MIRTRTTARQQRIAAAAVAPIAGRGVLRHARAAGERARAAPSSIQRTVTAFLDEHMATFPIPPGFHWSLGGHSEGDGDSTHEHSMYRARARGNVLWPWLGRLKRDWMARHEVAITALFGGNTDTLIAAGKDADRPAMALCHALDLHTAHHGGKITHTECSATIASTSSVSVRANQKAPVRFAAPTVLHT
jgi:hypothetical protein